MNLAEALSERMKFLESQNKEYKQFIREGLIGEDMWEKIAVLVILELLKGWMKNDDVAKGLIKAKSKEDIEAVLDNPKTHEAIASNIAKFIKGLGK